MYLQATLRCACGTEWEATSYDWKFNDLCPNCGSSVNGLVHVRRYDREGGPLVEESGFDGFGRQLWTRTS
jgi:hypothetical protein